MVILDKLEISPFGPCRFIGKSVYARMGARYSGFIFGGLWGSSGPIFAQLDQSRLYAPEASNKVAYITGDKWDEQKQLIGYTVGRFMEADAPVLDGLDSFDVPALLVAKGWIRGKFKDLFGPDAYRLVEEAIQRDGRYEIACDGPNALNAEVYTPESVPDDEVETVIGMYYGCREKAT